MYEYRCYSLTFKKNQNKHIDFLAHRLEDRHHSHLYFRKGVVTLFRLLFQKSVVSPLLAYTVVSKTDDCHLTDITKKFILTLAMILS